MEEQEMEEERSNEGQKNKKRILNKRRLTIVLPVVGALVLAAVLLVATGVVASPLPLMSGHAGDGATAATVPTSIFYQGRITDAAGDPITGTYVMTFSLYTQLSGGTALAQDSHSVQVSSGLFRTYMTFPAAYYNGQALFVGVQVEGDAEMSPRHYLRPVPYALSLRPGAVVSGEVASAQPALKVVNTGAGNAVRGANDSASAAAVAGVNVGSGPGGYFDSAGDYALYVDGDLFVNGSVWSKSYRNVIVVAKGDGGDYTSIQSALDNITDAAEDNPYLVRVMPGVYEEQVTLKSHVTVQGSGWRLTAISSTAPSGTVYVSGAINPVLSNLRVINTYGDAIANWAGKNVSIEGVVVQGNTCGIYNRGFTTTVEIRNSVINVVGTGSHKRGVYAEDGTSVDISHSLISVSGGTNVYGVEAYGGGDVSVNISDSHITADGQDAVYGVRSTYDSQTTIQRTTIRASSSETGAEVYGIYNITSGTVLTATNTTVEVSGEGATNIDGVHNESHAVAMLDNCTIRATGDSATQFVIGARNTSTSTLILRRSVIHVSGNLAYSYGIYNISWATTNIWFSEIYADATDGVVRGIYSYRGAPFNVYYSTVSATGGGAAVGEDAYGLYTSQGNQSKPTEILIRGGTLSGEDWAIGNDDLNTSYTIKVIETWLDGAVDTDDTYVCLGAHDGTNYLSATCQP
jgi:hypothetical protein